MSSKRIVDEQGNIVQERDYPVRISSRLLYGETSKGSGNILCYQCSGKEEDENAVDLYYFGARYYQSEARPLWSYASVGRFLTPDPARQGGSSLYLLSCKRFLIEW